tara:strand:+ start:1626 stop:1955 length:330 start_codon:yes stop_codon:yes gene_type:complete
MNLSTKKWLFIKFSSLILIPFMVWFIINLAGIYDLEYREIVNFFSKKMSIVCFSLFLIFAYIFSALTISEIFEDYIHDEKIKNVASKALFTFATIIPLITITGILILTL